MSVSDFLRHLGFDVKQAGSQLQINCPNCDFAGSFQRLLRLRLKQKCSMYFNTTPLSVQSKPCTRPETPSRNWKIIKWRSKNRNRLLLKQKESFISNNRSDN
jgi:hypothetical protein